MTTLILMRHGNTFEKDEIPRQIGARTDLPLTDFGENQARQMAKALKVNQPKAIFAGNLKRQMQSATIIAEELHLKVQYTPALTEIDYGLWEGLSAEQIQQKWPQEYVEWNEKAKWQSHIFVGSFEKHQNALTEWLKSLREIFPNQLVFGVTSNGLLRFFHKEKVKTGHFCKLILHPTRVEICNWNMANE